MSGTVSAISAATGAARGSLRRIRILDRCVAVMRLPSDVENMLAIPARRRTENDDENGRENAEQCREEDLDGRLLGDLFSAAMAGLPGQVGVESEMA